MAGNLNMKLRTISDSILETYEPLDMMSSYGAAAKVPVGNGVYEIRVGVLCTRGGLRGGINRMTGCNASVAESDFKKYIWTFARPVVPGTAPALASAPAPAPAPGGIVAVTRDEAVSMQRVPRAEDAPPESKPLAFSEVVVERATKDQLYSAALAWFGDTFGRAKTVLDVQDKERGQLVAKQSFTYAPKALVGSAGIKGTVKFVVTVEVKDGKYRYTIDGFTHEGTPGQGAPSSFGLLTTDARCPYPVEGPTSAGKQETWEYLKSLAKTEADTLTASLKRRMADATKAGKEW
jgi:hypothetical protein